MQAVKLRPEELLGPPVRSDWLLLWRLLPRGLPSNGEARDRKGAGIIRLFDTVTISNGENEQRGFDAQISFPHNSNFSY